MAARHTERSSSVRQYVGTLQVKVVSLDNIPSTDMIGKGDPYVQINIGSQEWKSSVQKGPSPTMTDADCHSFKIPSWDSSLTISVWDWDRISSNDKVGEFALSMAALKDDPNLELGMERKLEFDPLIKPRKGARPSMQVELLFTPMALATTAAGMAAGVITITLSKGTNLHKAPGVTNTLLSGIDPYVMIAIGDKSFRSCSKFKTANPVWNEKARFVLPRGHSYKGARFAVHDKDWLSADDPISEGFASLEELIEGEGEKDIALWPILQKHKSDPNMNKEMGKVHVLVDFDNMHVEEQRFYLQMFTQSDENQDGQLELQEFKAFVTAIARMRREDDVLGCEVISEQSAETLFRMCDADGSKTVSRREMAHFMSRNPKVDNMEVFAEPEIFLAWLNTALDREPLEKLMGSTTTETAAVGHGLFGLLSDWNSDQHSFSKGVNVGERAQHILVQNRKTGVLEEEVIDPSINYAMRLLYQTSFGSYVRSSKSTTVLFSQMSARQGAKYEDPHSTGHIAGFVDAFNIDVSECEKEVKDYKNFNEFFYRKLKPGARTINQPDHTGLACQPCDCRLSVFNDISSAQRLWVKGENFSVEEMLGFKGRPEGDKYLKYKNLFEGGSISIHRLAPQDYHRFHVPVTCRVEDRIHCEGELWTVNPVAINTVDVFTENKRYVTMLSTEEFGLIAYVSIGAHMVGTIEFTEDPGDTINKGNEMGYFKFGGSTVICVWQKGAIKFDDDLLKISAESTEMLVSLGDTFGEAQGRIPPELRWDDV